MIRASFLFIEQQGQCYLFNLILKGFGLPVNSIFEQDFLPD